MLPRSTQQEKRFRPQVEVAQRAFKKSSECRDTASVLTEKASVCARRGQGLSCHKNDVLLTEGYCTAKIPVSVAVAC